METLLRADVVVMLDGKPFNIAQALYEVRHRADLVRRIERQARQLHSAAVDHLVELEHGHIAALAGAR